MASKEQLRQWFDMGVRNKNTHMLIVVDGFDHEDYPVFVASTQNVQALYDSYNRQNMQRVVEVYDLRLDRESQLAEGRAFHL